MNEKFKNIPVDDDTNITSSLQVKFSGLDCVYQQWTTEGIQGSSLIFYANDVASNTNQELEQWLRESPLLKQQGSAVTVSRNADSEYVFVNFNFSED